MCKHYDMIQVNILVLAKAVECPSNVKLSYISGLHARLWVVQIAKPSSGSRLAPSPALASNFESFPPAPPMMSSSPLGHAEAGGGRLLASPYGPAPVLSPSPTGDAATISTPSLSSVGCSIPGTAAGPCSCGAPDMPPFSAPPVSPSSNSMVDEAR